MIEAYISGQAARVAFVEGTEVTYLDAEEPLTLRSSSQGSLYRLFEGADDVERRLVARREDAFAPLLLRYSVDRALRMLDIAIDTGLQQELRSDAAEAYVDLTKDEAVSSLVENYVLATPRLEVTDEFDARRYNSKFVEAMDRLSRLQTSIIRVAAALHRSLDLQVESDEERRLAYCHVVTTGAFKRIVLGLVSKEAINTAILDVYGLLRDLRGSRAIVHGWTSQFVSKQPKRDLKDVVFEEQEWADIPDVDTSGSHSGVFDAVMSQQAFIVKKLVAGDADGARRFAAELIRWQLEISDVKYAARSMSKLAIEARRVGEQSLELEWAKAATELNPNDARGLALLADTYLELLRLPEAEEAFERAVRLSNAEFSVVGLARVHRVAGQLDKAAEELRKAIQLYSESPTIHHAWLALAEVLREHGRPMEASKAYDDGLSLFPHISELWCGKASTLRDLGRFDEAEQLTRRAIEIFPNEAVPYSILAEIWHDNGRLEEALAIYEEAVARFPNEPVIANARAALLADMGLFEASEQAFGSSRTRFPYEPMAICGLAQSRRSQGDLMGALAAYEEAIKLFPLNVVARGGHANALKLLGRFDEALAAYDRNIRDFPFDIVSMNNRATLLKLLGRYRDAVAAYEALLEKRPDFIRATYAKASALIALQRFDEAAKLLPTNSPSTDDEWLGQHVRGLLMLKMGNLSAARRIFSEGAVEAVFSRRRVFSASLAVVEMRLKNYDNAIAALEGDRDELSAAFAARCYLEIGNVNMAMEKLEAANDNYPAFVTYTEELRRGAKGVSTKSEAWFDEMELELSLQAA